MSAAPRTAPIRFGAPAAQRWIEGGNEVWLLSGKAYIQQGELTGRAEQAVIWAELGRYGERTGKVTVYLEQDVEVERTIEAKRKTDRITGKDWLGSLESSEPIDIRTGPVGPEPAVKPALYRNALQKRNPLAGTIRRTQFLQPVPGPADTAAPVSVEQLPPGTRRVRAFPRSGFAPTIDYFPNERDGEWVALITGGVNVIVDGLQIPQVGMEITDSSGAVDLAADRIVVWTGGMQEPDLGPNATTVQQSDTPLEIYMEGNIVFRQGERKIEAQRMYYDVRAQVGVVLEADVLTPVREYSGLVRLRARILRQLGPDRFIANDAFVTSSLMGRPTYRLQAGDVVFEDHQHPAVDPLTGQPILDPVSGEQVIHHDRLAQSTNNFLYFDEFPIFYWPTLATDLEEPTYYLKSLRFRTDRIFGTQVLTTFDAYQLLGISNAPEGTEWNWSLDYMSERGLGLGTDFRYTLTELFGQPGPASGFLDAWAIHDGGNDTLGADRMNVTHDVDFRYRVLGQHRQQLPDGWQLTGELGLISDRNFLEQYYENEWDQLKDQTTGIEIKRSIDNMSYGISADARVNDFFAQTEGVRLDHFWLGQPLLGDRLTWYEHTSLAYNRLQAASPPTDPTDAAKFAPLPWEVDASGERLITRQEIDYPFEVGPVKFVPYLLGEAGHWGEDINGDDFDRLYGQAGLRASIPFWTANPFIESDLFNVHGIAHKVVLDAELLFADASRDLDELPLYEQVDDDSIEHFRRRLAFNTFNATPTTIPPQFDERSYALRSGLGSWVTSPSMEIADDLTALRMGVRQRWQTKRGLPQSRRILDWIVLDTQATIFPNENRDNFGEPLGLVEYYFRWHVGDRLTLVSDGSYDTFEDGQKLTSIGAFLNRPPRGSLYLGLQSLAGPFDSQVVSASYTYRMSPKWYSTAGASVDLSSGGSNIGQNFTVMRIGEVFVTSFAFNVDHSKDNVGVMLNVEPRFLRFLPAGAFGLE